MCNGRALEIRLDQQNRNPKIEGRYKIHIGKPYRAQIQNTTYEGILTAIGLHICDQGFVERQIELSNGMAYQTGDPSEKATFKLQILRDNELRCMLAFGIILNEKGFKEARKNMEKPL